MTGTTRRAPRRPRRNGCAAPRATRRAREVGQDPRQARRQHGLARARGAHQEEVVSTGGCDLQRAARHQLTPDVEEIGLRRARRGPGGAEAATLPRAPHRAATRRRSATLDAGRTRSPATNAASTEAPTGTTTCSASMAATKRRDRRDRRGQTRRGPSSPTKPVPSTHRAGRTSDATSSPMAMGRSSPAPVLRTPDGARFTVTRRVGHGSWHDKSAARTRSRDSRTAASGSPTTVKPGRPADTWTSTDTERPSTPNRVAEGIQASMGTPQRGDTVRTCHTDRGGPPDYRRPREGAPRE